VTEAHSIEGLTDKQYSWCHIYKFYSEI